MSSSVTTRPSRLDGRRAVFRGTATGAVGSRYSLMGLPPDYGVRMGRNTSAEPFEKVQPGTMAENRPAVPPATGLLMLSGDRNFAIGESAPAGSGKFRRTRSAGPSPPS